MSMGYVPKNRRNIKRMRIARKKQPGKLRNIQYMNSLELNSTNTKQTEKKRRTLKEFLKSMF